MADERAVPGLRHVRGKIYVDQQGKRVYLPEVRRLREEYEREAPDLRELIFKQRVQEQRLEHVLRTGKQPDNPPPQFDRERDERMTRFAYKQRSKRSKEEWNQFRADMEAIYGPDRKDWGDYD